MIRSRLHRREEESRTGEISVLIVVREKAIADIYLDPSGVL